MYIFVNVVANEFLHAVKFFAGLYLFDPYRQTNSSKYLESDWRPAAVVHLDWPLATSKDLVNV
jgi:hypothetical protein